MLVDLDYNTKRKHWSKEYLEKFKMELRILLRIFTYDLKPL